MPASATLPSGAKIPLNGFGTWRAAPEQVHAAVTAALDAGYRHIDCAPVYRNEKDVGNAMKAYFDKTGLARESVFVTSKVWNSCHSFENVIKSCRQSLADLQLDYLDLLLVHHPYSWKFGGLPITRANTVLHDADGNIDWGEGVSLEMTWRGMEECKRLGLVRDIGVSNYPAVVLMDMLQYAKIRPAVNQCEAHVYFNRKELRDICAQIGVHVTMYSVLANGKEGPLGDKTVAAIAQRKNATPAQILIAWGLATGCSVLSKSSQPERVRANFAAATVELSDEDMAQLDALDCGLRTINQVNHWGFASHV